LQRGALEQLTQAFENVGEAVHFAGLVGGQLTVLRGGVADDVLSPLVDGVAFGAYRVGGHGVAESLEGVGSLELHFHVGHFR
jgi:hypothetical protein